VAAEAKTVDDEMIAITPYLVPTPAEMQLLAGLRKHNARVRVLTNSLVATPSSAAHAGYMHYRPALLKEGVELYEIRAMLGSTRGTGQGKSISRRGNYGLHAKLYVFDRKAMFVGSMNFDQRSKRLNTEIGLVIYSAALARQTAVRFDALVQPDNAYHVELSDAGRDDRALLWKTRESGADTIHTTEPARSAWQRFKVKVLSWLPLDREL
jgi:putative cardiolipin synthase